jgi:hypothetical protein
VTSQHRAVDVLGPGDYVLLVKEGGTPNIFGGSDNAFVRVRRTSKTTTFRDSLGGGGAAAPPIRTSEHAPSRA